MSAVSGGAHKADFASCAICGPWPSALRSTMRSAINVLPPQGHLCDNCFEAFWANIDHQASAKRQRPS